MLKTKFRSGRSLLQSSICLKILQLDKSEYLFFWNALGYKNLRWAKLKILYLFGLEIAFFL
jgi:hypothetical protein